MKTAGQRPMASKAPLQKRPAWVDDIPSKREALKSLASQQTYCDTTVVNLISISTSCVGSHLFLQPVHNIHFNLP
jgi:hypothetical protein